MPAKEIDCMNLRRTYIHFLLVIKNLIENDVNLKKNIQESQLEINEYIMRSLHRQ